MMSAFFHFQHTLNRLFNNLLDKFFWKYEGGGEMGKGVGCQIDSPTRKKLTSKSPALLGLNSLSDGICFDLSYTQ